MRTIYAAAWHDQGDRVLKCFGKREWAVSYVNYLKSQESLWCKFTNRLFTTGYIVIPLELCDRPPTLAETGNTIQQ